MHELHSLSEVNACLNSPILTQVFILVLLNSLVLIECVYELSVSYELL